MKRYIFDTREPFEYEQSHVDGAINLPPQSLMGDDLPGLFNTIRKDDEIILYCRSGMRSNTTGRILQSHGYTNIVNGINEQHVNKLLEAQS